MYHSFIIGPGSSCALNLLIWGVQHQCMYDMIHDVSVLQKRLMQTRLDFDRDIIGATIDQ